MSSLPHLNPGWSSHNMLVGRYRFMRGPVGYRESELQNELAKFLQNKSQVKAAYFATIEYVSGTFTGPALCLKTSYAGETMDLVEAAGEIFTHWFVEPERMDVTFLTDEQEMDLEKICQPFYARPGHNADLYENGLPLTGLVCPHCVSGKSRILHAFRAAPSTKGDSGWQFYCKCGMPEDPTAIKTLSLKEIVKMEPTLRGWLETPIGMNLWRATGKSRWEQIKKEKLNGPNGRNGNGTNGSNGHHHGSNGANGKHSANGLNGHDRYSQDNLGNGMHSPNGEVNFVRETGMPFGALMGKEANAEPQPEELDPIREYVQLRASWPHPVEIALYYECFGCGEVLSSGSEGKCRCGNIVISSGVVKIENLTKASAFRQR